MWKIYAGKVRLEEIKLGSISTRQYKKEKDIFSGHAAPNRM